MKLGAWQMVLWQPRWVYATTDALCYQKITADERPIGKVKSIKFDDIIKIDELEFGEFAIEMPKRNYTFKAPDDHTCQVRAQRSLPSLHRFPADLRPSNCRCSCTICASCVIGIDRADEKGA